MAYNQEQLNQITEIIAPLQADFTDAIMRAADMMGVDRDELYIHATNVLGIAARIGTYKEYEIPASSDVELKLKAFVTEIHENAKAHGWWDDETRSFPELISLCHSELSEALEEYRKGHLPHEEYHSDGGKPEGIPSELADVIIRIFDLCGRYDIDIERVILEKHEYNKTRPYKHGGKVI